MGSILDSSDQETVRRVAEVVRDGGVCVYPTATLFGLGGDPRSRSVSTRIHDIKRTPYTRPHLVLTDEWERLDGWIDGPTSLHRHLMRIGQNLPVTILFDAGADAPPHLIGPKGQIACRQTGHDICRRLIGVADCPIISTSANRSGGHAPNKFEDIDPDILEEADIAIRASPCSGAPSTMVSVEDGHVVFVRVGGTSRESILAELTQTQA